MSSTVLKKRLDEKNSKLIRELSIQPSNRHCFECGQRGPTYVNVTEGSFCCTACSGILRGLNPPYRVKSISMATFTTEEVEKLRKLGNAENAKTWLGLYCSSPPAIMNKEELYSFLVKKYEKKTWYVSPDELAEQERLISKAKEVASIDSSSGGGSILDSAIPKANGVNLFASDPFDGFTSIARDSSRNNFQMTDHTPFSPPAFLAPPPPKVHNNVDIFFTDSLFTTNTHNVSNTPMAPGLPNLKDNFDFGLPPCSTAQPNVASFENPFMPTVTQVSTSNNFAPDSIFNGSTTSRVPPIAAAPEHNGDKYSALAELDEMFHKHPQKNSENEKPHWMPSGFSTGLPPMNHHFETPVSSISESTFCTPTFPKSSTMGALSDYRGVNPFLDNKFSTSSGNVDFSNPFLTPELPRSNVQPAAPPVPPRPQQSPWTANFQQSNIKGSGVNDVHWNPFL